MAPVFKFVTYFTTGTSVETPLCDLLMTNNGVYYNYFNYFIKTILQTCSTGLFWIEMKSYIFHHSSYFYEVIKMIYRLMSMRFWSNPQNQNVVWNFATHQTLHVFFLMRSTNFGFTKLRGKTCKSYKAFLQLCLKCVHGWLRGR